MITNCVLILFYIHRVSTFDIFPTGELRKPPNYQNFVPPKAMPRMGPPGPDGLPVLFPQAPLPESYEDAITYAKYQGKTCAACYAFAAVAVLESKFLKKYGYEFLDLSEQELISCAQDYDGCEGGTSFALRYWASNEGPMGGPMMESCAPFVGERVTCNRSWCGAYRTRGAEFGQFYNFDVDYDREREVKESIMNDGPGYLSFRVNFDFYEYWATGYPGQVYHYDSWSKYNGRHAILLYGWDDRLRAWKCKNSWGYYKGPYKNGTLLMPFDQARMLDYYFANLRLEADETPPPIVKKSDLVRIRSFDYRDAYLQHAYFRIFLRQISTEARKAAATWRKLPGLADSSCSSFESVTDPGFYIRQKDGALFLEEKTKTKQWWVFDSDATFCEKSPLSTVASSSWHSFEPKALPGYFLRHNYWLGFVDKPDGTWWFDDAATFIVEPLVDEPMGLAAAPIASPSSEEPTNTNELRRMANRPRHPEHPDILRQRPPPPHIIAIDPSVPVPISSKPKQKKPKQFLAKHDGDVQTLNPQDLLEGNKSVITNITTLSDPDLLMINKTEIP